MINQEEYQAISTTLNNYFDGIYDGDVEKLRGSFAENAFLYGDIAGAPYRKTLDEYLDGVKTRKSPSELDEEFAMKIMGIEVIGQVAIAKAHLPMLGFNYYDFLSLAKLNGEWKIVNKVFSHVA